MLLPSEWLAKTRATDFYPERELTGLRECGIRYDGGTLTSLLQGAPEGGYPTFGRLSEVPLHTEREIIAIANELGFQPFFTIHETETLVFGYELITSVWRLVRPITVWNPPSYYQPEPDVKARLDLAAIKEYGY